MVNVTRIPSLIGVQHPSGNKISISFVLEWDNTPGGPFLFDTRNVGGAVDVPAMKSVYFSGGLAANGNTGNAPGALQIRCLDTGQGIVIGGSIPANAGNQVPVVTGCVPLIANQGSVFQIDKYGDGAAFPGNQAGFMFFNFTNYEMPCFHTISLASYSFIQAQK